MNTKYSYKDYTNQILTTTDPADWNNSEVIGSCFYQFEPDTQVFPAGITGVTFTKCNLDNVVIPSGCTVVGGCNRKIKVQNDGEDWLLKANGNPEEPLYKAKFQKLGLSILPSNIPATPVSIPITISREKELEGALRATILARTQELEATATWR